jgi:Ca2+-binding EF-hand superfamily protein
MGSLDKKDFETLIKKYDKDGNQTIDAAEMADIVRDVAKGGESLPPEVREAVMKFDLNSDGKIDESEVNAMVEEINSMSQAMRYAAYTNAFARAFRYLAFTSDVGEALRPVVSPRIVTGLFRCLCYPILIRT